MDHDEGDEEEEEEGYGDQEMWDDAIDEEFDDVADTWVDPDVPLPPPKKRRA